MDWTNERYVRLYTRDSTDMVALRWEGRLVLYELLRKADRAGILDHGGDLALLPELLRVPPEIFDIGLERLVARGVVVARETALVIRNFLEAQEATWTGAQRMREHRARRRDRSLNGETNRHADETDRHADVTKRNAGVTRGDAGVTRGDAVFKKVTPSRTDPADPTDPDLASEVSDPGPPKQVRPIPLEAVQVAESIARHVLARDPGSSKLRNEESRKKTVAAWADSVRLLHERDGRPWPEISAVWKWARADERFWSDKVLSGQNLRKHFDKLVLAMKRPANGSGRPLPPQPALLDLGRVPAAEAALKKGEP